MVPVRERPAHFFLPAQERELGALPAGFQVECQRKQAQLQAFLPKSGQATRPCLTQVLGNTDSTKQLREARAACQDSEVHTMARWGRTRTWAAQLAGSGS